MSIEDRNLNFVVVGCPENRRIALFQDALARLGYRPPRVVGYLDLLHDRVSLEDVIDEDSLVRIDSPGENFEVERELIALGAEGVGEGASRISAQDARKLEFDRGRILFPRQRRLGFLECLTRIERELIKCGAARVMNPPRDIAAMFDKRRCHQLFNQANVPAPRSLGDIGSYEALRQRMREMSRPRVFIKLAWGSSGSGVVAYETQGEREQAWTSVETVRSGGSLLLYNSLKFRRYRDSREIAGIIDVLCAEGVQVEEWIPKPGFDGATADVRIVVIDGEASHAVLRLGRGPVTNLHLGNRRGNLGDYIRGVGAAWDEARRAAERAAAMFPGSIHAGVDLALTRPGLRPVVFEINAFGDLLPGVLHNGLDTYSAIAAAAVRRFGAGDRTLAKGGGVDA